MSMSHFIYKMYRILWHWTSFAVSSRWSLTRWSILPHLTTSILGHQPCRVSPRPFRSACCLGLEQPSLIHVHCDDTLTKHNMACDSLFTVTCGLVGPADYIFESMIWTQKKQSKPKGHLIYKNTGIKIKHKKILSELYPVEKNGAHWLKNTMNLIMNWLRMKQ